MKIVINSDYGGFSLSKIAYEWLIKNKGWTVTEYTEDGLYYEDPNADLVRDSDYKGEGSFTYYPLCSTSSKELRSNPDLIEVIKTLKKKANGDYACLKVIEVPDMIGNNWEIGGYDGKEWVQELHNRWD